MRKSLVFFWVAAVTGCIFFSLFLVNVLAKEPAGPEIVYYTYIEIQPGDTLWSIAKTYTEGTDITVDEYIRRLKQMNRMRDNTIHEGHYLTVMYQKPSGTAEEQ